MNSPQELLENYVRALNSHEWEKVRPLVDEHAVFIFSEGTHEGIEAIGQAIQRTFAHIQDETYRVEAKHWTLVTGEVAVCFYNFFWSGRVNGQLASGSGRGTSVLRRTPSGWKIFHEHLGPAPKN